MNTSILRRINENKIRTALKYEGLSNKNSLSNLTALSVATCGSILSNLIEIGEVIEIDHAPSSGGRRSRQFKYNKDFAYLLSLYIRKEGYDKNIIYTISNLFGDVIETKCIECDFIDILIIDETISDIINNNDRISCMSIGIPAVINEGVIGVCDFTKLSHFPIKKYLEDKFRIPIVIENDVNATALGFYNINNYEDNENFAYVYYPIDGHPGSGIVVNAKLVYGATNFSGEVSYLPLGESLTNVRNNPDNNFLEQVTKTLSSIACIINPKDIVISGFKFTEFDLDVIKHNVEAIIPSPHTPHIVFEEDFHNSYMYGLVSMALDLYAVSV